MICRPVSDTKINSLHILKNRLDKSQKTFEWTGTTWSTPGTGYGTPPTVMAVLGWEYSRPVNSPNKNAVVQPTKE